MKQSPSNTQPATPLSLGHKLLASENFMELFRNGMELVEETASYLEGRGKEQSRKLEPAISLAYISESMRLTTRLMQLASWLLLQRAVIEGEIEQTDAQNNKNKLPSEKKSSETPEDILLQLPKNYRN